MDKNKAFLLENKLLNYYSHLCNLLMFLLTKTFARSIINGPNLFGKFSKIMKCSYRNPCNSPRWVLDSPKFSHPDESWTHQSFLTQMSPGLTKVFSPRWVLDSPKFSNFRFLQWWESSIFSEMSSGLNKINCYNYPTICHMNQFLKHDISYMPIPHTFTLKIKYNIPSQD